ncbi:uncharacterized protein LOC111124600 [Crassostrea virginica]
MEEEFSKTRIISNRRTIEGNRCTLHFPRGVSDFLNLFSLNGKAEQIQFQQILHLLYLAGILNYEPFPDDPKSFIDYDALLVESLMFLGSFKLEISQKFYNSDFLTHPLEIISTITYVGTSSFCETREIANTNGLAPFVRSTYRMIRIDANTRKPIELPRPMREMYAAWKKGTPYAMRKLTRPDVHSINFHYTIQESDVDSQNHTNFITYIKLCLRACRRGTDLKAFPTPLLQIIDNGIKEFEIRYENEALLNEDVIIYAWQTKESDQLGFEISKGGDVCVQATMTFYRSSWKFSKMGSTASKM